MSEQKLHPMRVPRIAKLTLNLGAGKNQNLIDKGIKLFKSLTTVEPVKTITQKRIASWGLRPGLPVGAKVTIRGEEAHKLIPRLLAAKDHVLKESYFDNAGNISFGIQEYIDIEDIRYDASIGIIGMQISISLERPGYRVSKRRIFPSRIAKQHRISKEDAITFMKETFKVKVGDE